MNSDFTVWLVGIPIYGLEVIALPLVLNQVVPLLGILINCSHIFFRSDMQFMSNYTSAAAFRQPNEETKWKKWKKRRKQENLWLQDKLLTSTYNTGPDDFV